MDHRHYILPEAAEQGMCHGWDGDSPVKLRAPELFAYVTQYDLSSGRPALARRRPDWQAGLREDASARQGEAGLREDATTLARL